MLATICLEAVLEKKDEDQPSGVLRMFAMFPQLYHTIQPECPECYSNKNITHGNFEEARNITTAFSGAYRNSSGYLPQDPKLA